MSTKAASVNADIFSDIITLDQTMIDLFKQVTYIADSGQPVLITGETGVGKELFAKAVHRASTLIGQFVPVNGAGLDDNVFSDTLFGHLKGAFTGADRIRQGMIEKAKKGSLFLDEIGDLSTVSQIKLLRLLQEHEYLPLGGDEYKKSTARVITATNRDLWSFQRTGQFRSDLNFRLRTHHIDIPPLRDRKNDIPLLADHFLESAANTLNKKRPTPPKELLPLLKQYQFPGNVREMQAMFFDAVSRHDSKILSLETFKEHIAHQTENNFTTSEIKEDSFFFPVPFSNKFPTIKEAVRMLVLEAMKQAHSNQSVAARLLGISRQALNKRLKDIKQVAIN